MVKAGELKDHHLAREIRAHNEWLASWTSTGRAPALVHADGEAKLLVTRYLPGELVQGSGHEHQPDTYRQAGELLAKFHGQCAVEDAMYEAREKEKALVWLGRPHRIDADLTDLLREVVESWPTPGPTRSATSPSSDRITG